MAYVGGRAELSPLTRSAMTVVAGNVHTSVDLIVAEGSLTLSLVRDKEQ